MVVVRCRHECEPKLCRHQIHITHVGMPAHAYARQHVRVVKPDVAWMLQSIRLILFEPKTIEVPKFMLFANTLLLFYSRLVRSHIL